MCTLDTHTSPLVHVCCFTLGIPCVLICYLLGLICLQTQKKCDKLPLLSLTFVVETVLLFHYSEHAEREGRIVSVKTEDMTGSSDRCNLDFVNSELFSENSSKDDLYCFLKQTILLPTY